MSRIKLNFLGAALLVVLLVALVLRTNPTTAQLEGYTDLNGLKLTNSSFGTATPALLIQNGGSGNSLEIRNSGATPVLSIGNSGALSGFGSNGLAVTVPTAVGTATPALLINSAGGVGELFSVRKNSTPQVVIDTNGLQTNSAGLSVAPNVVVAGPTALATATPVLYVNSASAHNLVVIAKAATPVFVVGNDGAIVTGQVIKNTAGYEETCGVQTVTGAATTTPHNLSTPVAVQANLAADPVGDQIVSYTNAAAVITLKVWKNNAGTPTASTDAVSVAWCAKGTP